MIQRRGYIKVSPAKKVPQSETGTSFCLSCGNPCVGHFCNSACEESQQSYFASWLAENHPEQVRTDTDEDAQSERASLSVLTGNGTNQNRAPEDCWHCRGTLRCECIFCFERNQGLGTSRCRYCLNSKAAIAKKSKSAKAGAK
jgi:hypothetical protein